ncbi:glycosyltransferase family 2 protein [Empedobacter stercoris]|uniref:glycosyltransferase family 2 protein n=1 Tax=Empedobacter stercoris TaxID=1628248 RepID=UPI0039EA1BB4
MNEIKLAIVIPYYKLTYFEETLRSLSNQTDNRFNLYIGNDNSPEDPSTLIESYRQKINLTYLKFEENYGGQGKLVEQWERSIALTNEEEYIQILGDDDLVSDNFVETFYEIIYKKGNFDLLRFKMLKISEQSKILKEFNQIENLNSKQHLLNDLNQIYWISISENVFSREVFEKRGIRKYPLAWRSDAMLVFEFGMDNLEISNQAFVGIRRSEVQLTTNVSAKVVKYKKTAMSIFYNDLLNEYELRFNKYEKIKFVKKLIYYTEKINSNQKKIIRNNLSLFTYLKYYLLKK